LSRRRRREGPAPPRKLAPPRPEGRAAPPAAWGQNLEALALPANAAVGRSGSRAQRYDVFALMYFHPLNLDGSRFETAWYDAVRRLQEDLAILHRTQGTSDAIRVTGAGQIGALAMAPARSEAELVRFVTSGFGAARLEAGLRVFRALAAMTPWRARLIMALAEPEAISGREVNWRQAVRRLTGTIDRREAGRLVREVAAELAQAYLG